MFTEFDRKSLFYKFTTCNSEKKKWEDYIKMAIRELDPEDRRWMKLAQDHFQGLNLWVLLQEKYLGTENLPNNMFPFSTGLQTTCLVLHSL
jgi:hypothetical protein